MKKKYKAYCYVLALFYLIFTFSFIAFVACPRIFYWRSWEYFAEIAYHIPKMNKWKGYEIGGFERVKVKKYDDIRAKWKTTVSCDEGGFRSVPYKADHYPIVLGGDSHTWGAGLSDHQTIPWQVGKKLSLPVYNTARSAFTIQRFLKNPNLARAKILIELHVRDHLECTYFLTDPTLDQGIMSIGSKKKSHFKFTEVHPNRYFLPAKIMREIKYIDVFKLKHLMRPLLEGFFSSALKKGPPAAFNTEEGMRRIAERAIMRGQAFNKMGYIYVFGVIPAIHNVDYHRVDPTTLRPDALLNDLLMESQVHYVDIPSAIYNHPFRKTLYLVNDTHINEYGAEIIADVIVNYFEANLPEVLDELKEKFPRKKSKKR